MALNPALLKQELEAVIAAGLNSEFSSEMKANSKAKAAHQRLAKAISEIADVIVKHLTTMAQVAPGIVVAGPGGGGVTTTPGKIT